MAMRQASVTFAPVGDTNNNGYDLGGARIYPINYGMAVSPSAMWSNYIGPANSLPIAPPIAAQVGTTGVGTSSNQTVAAITSPFGRKSPLPWVVLGLVGAVIALHFMHYKP